MTTPNTTEAPTSDSVIEWALHSLATRIDAVEEERDQLYAQRLAFWRQAVEKGWTQARIAEASGVQEGAVTQGLRRARLSGR